MNLLLSRKKELGIERALEALVEGETVMASVPGPQANDYTLVMP
jgi:hypothetical protein